MPEAKNSMDPDASEHSPPGLILTFPPDRYTHDKHVRQNVEQQRCWCSFPVCVFLSCTSFFWVKNGAHPHNFSYGLGWVGSSYNPITLCSSVSVWVGWREGWLGMVETCDPVVPRKMNQLFVGFSVCVFDKDQ